MNLDINYFRSIQGTLNCNNEKEYKVKEIQDNFTEDFDSSIGVEYSVLRNDIKQDFIITFDKNKECHIIPRPSEKINIGDVIFWNNIYWLVVDKNLSNTIHTIGTMVSCNRKIKWQNPKTLDIIERWCFCSKPYASNLNEGKVLTTLNGKYNIKLPYDNETKLIGVDRRFMFDITDGIAEVYKVEFADKNTNKYANVEGGFIEWTLGSDLPIDGKDNMELMICDYTEPQSPTPHLPELLVCDIDGRDSIKIGCKRTYKPIFYNKEGTKVVDVIPKWELICADKYRSYFKIEQNDDSISVVCSDIEDIIGEDFTLKLYDSNGLYNACELNVKVVSLFG